jgi:hypothetical protein
MDAVPVRQSPIEQRQRIGLSANRDARILQGWRKVGFEARAPKALDNELSKFRFIFNYENAHGFSPAQKLSGGFQAPCLHRGCKLARGH